MEALVPAQDGDRWRTLLESVGPVEPSFLPEYHRAYALRVPGAQAHLFAFSQGGAHFAYPFLLTPIDLAGRNWHDISSVYGYTGPLASTDDPAFLHAAWRAFDAWACELGVVAEFVRFSPFHANQRFAHPGCEVTINRQLAVSHLPATEPQLLSLLGSKTRNMLRKAQREGLTAQELSLPDRLPDFRRLYELTMRRNDAPEFFWYDDAYWSHLLGLGASGLRLFGVFAANELVGAAMAVVHGRAALYHLGASLPDQARLGAGNLSLWCMSNTLMRDGVTFINLTGGRTTAPDDPLLLFKRSNGTALAPFHIGRRVLDSDAYNQLRSAWTLRHGIAPDAGRLIFWRS